MVEIKLQKDELTVEAEHFRLALAVGDKVFAIGKGTNRYKMNHGSFRIKAKVEQKKTLTVTSVERAGEDYLVKFDLGALRLTLEGSVVKFCPEGFDGFNRMWLTLPSDAKECFYGSGEVFSEYNLKGLKATVWVSEHINVLQTTHKLLQQALGRHDARLGHPFHRYQTYYAQPTFVSSHRYFYHSLATARCVFSFDQHHTLVESDEIAPFYLGFAPDYEGLMTALTDIVGRQPELPDWVYDGRILGIQGGTEVMLNKYRHAKETGSEVCGLWIQDWEGRRVTSLGKQLYWNWQWDQDLYPELDRVIQDLGKEGVKVLGYCNPFLAVEKPLYQEATAKGYCVKDKEGKDYMVTITTFPAAMVDLTNPEAYLWIKEIIKRNMIGLGLSGWMADFGEYLPPDAVLYSGEDAELIHNTWPARWAKVNREALEETGNLGKILFFTRAGHSDTPRYSTMMWNGDNHPDFSFDFGLPSIIPAMLSLTLCGFGLSHSDVGGYTSLLNLRRSKEAYIRWCEMNAFSPLMRGHEGLNPELNAQFDRDEDTLRVGGMYSRIHLALKPYLKEAVALNAQKGVGVVRPMFFYYDEREAYTNGHQYLLGRDLLVAPVLRPRATHRKVYLPQDEWVNLWTGETLTGGHHEVEAPIDRIPVFVRKSNNELFNRLQQAIK